MTLPTPVFVAGGALCLVAGYLIGAVAGPDSADQVTATVVSYETRTSELCLEGESVEDEKGVDDDGVLCGTWSHSSGATVPRQGDRFRFVSVDTSDVKGSEPRSEIVLYGSVVE